MRQLLDFLPWVIFFTVAKMYDFFVATQSLIITTGLVLLFLWVRFRLSGNHGGIKAFIKEEKMAVFAFVLVAIFGSFTIYFRNTGIMIWKVTIFYCIFSLILLISQFFFSKPLIQTLLGKELTLPRHIWSQLNLFWAFFFAACGAVNLYIGYNLPESTWITVKTFGFPAVIFVFTLLTGFYIYRFLPKDDETASKESSVDSSKYQD
jgi:intracellular septation protein